MLSAHGSSSCPSGLAQVCMSGSISTFRSVCWLACMSEAEGQAVYADDAADAHSGVWRRKTIMTVGGWQSRTTVEDMDLSLRTYVNGWKAIYLADTTCLNEVCLLACLLAFESGQTSTIPRRSGTSWEFPQSCMARQCSFMDGGSFCWCRLPGRGVLQAASSARRACRQGMRVMRC